MRVQCVRHGHSSTCSGEVFTDFDKNSWMIPGRFWVRFGGYADFWDSWDDPWKLWSDFHWKCVPNSSRLEALHMVSWTRPCTCTEKNEDHTSLHALSFNMIPTPRAGESGFLRSFFCQLCLHLRVFRCKHIQKRVTTFWNHKGGFSKAGHAREWINL